MREGSVTEEEWLKAKQEDRFYRYKVLGGIRPEFQISLNTITFVKFVKALHGSKFNELFEAVSGRTLGSLVHNVHCFERGDFLAKHSDDTENRQCAFVLYLSPGWDARDGGVLHLVDRNNV